MAEIQVNPTRMELNNLKRRLTTARRGHSLLKDKRDEMMRQFLELIREVRQLRAKIDETMKSVSDGFSAASAVMSPKAMQAALMLPGREGTLKIDSKQILNVAVPVFDFHAANTGAGGENGDTAGLSYGFAFTSGFLDAAVKRLTDMLPDLVRLAELEKSTQLLADEIERTRRRVNALEYIMIPRYEETIRSIVMKLDENERGNLTRQMKVKDMIAEKAILERRKANSFASE
ncbi:MAG: V-type ATP synthase subunit D [Eubacteriales bacterium]|jgi:V/A-type H+-transporting ATPase subunit D